jgi:hypothetical protein
MPSTGKPKTEREVVAFARRHHGRRAEVSVGGVAGLVARLAPTLGALGVPPAHATKLADMIDLAGKTPTPATRET